MTWRSSAGLRVFGVLALAGAGLGAPADAAAHNLDHPRTPVDWSGAPCLTVIDRGADGPVYPLAYAIPFEDTMLSPDEPPDSRRHQFFGFCRDHHFEDLQPNWISEADLDVAVELGLGALANVDLDAEVLDNDPRWQGCFVRINADDARRPITFEAAAEPVAWDTTGLDPGTYVVEAYTWEPWLNLWTEHPGVFRIVDEAGPASQTPAAALSFPEQVVEVGAEAPVTGCVDANPGATMSLAWAAGGSGPAPEWTTFATDVPVQNGAFELGFVGPEAAIGRYVLIRLELVDPSGRAWTAYSNHYIGVVAKGPSGDGGGDEGGDSAASDETGTAGDEDGEAADAPTGGCGACRVSKPGRDLDLGVVVVALGLLTLGAGRRARVRGGDWLCSHDDLRGK